MNSIGFSDYCRKNCQFGTGDSYAGLKDEQILEQVRVNWGRRQKGSGESGLNRKVLVPVSPLGFYCPPTMPLQVGMPINTRIVARQEGEDPYLESYIEVDEAHEWGFSPIPARYVNIVCYSAEALLENGGSRSTDKDWEIVCYLCSLVEAEPMRSLTMARNYLEKVGGTKGEYTAKEFAEAIWYWSTQKGIKVLRNSGSVE